MLNINESSFDTIFYKSIYKIGSQYKFPLNRGWNEDFALKPDTIYRINPKSITIEQNKEFNDLRDLIQIFPSPYSAKVLNPDFFVVEFIIPKGEKLLIKPGFDGYRFFTKCFRTPKVFLTCS